MKKQLILFMIFTSILCENIFPQIPESFNYQAALRNSTGELLKNQSVTIQVSIIENSATGDVVYREQHSKITNDFGLIDLQIGEGTSNLGIFTEIKWSSLTKFIKVEINTGSGFVNMGTSQLLSVPYALFAGTASNLGDEGIYTTDSDTLFVVKDHDGNPVFIVFPDGAKVINNQIVKGKVGGFAVSGRSPTKLGEEEEYLLVTPDSTRIYVNDTTTTKGKVGGFAVSGRSPTKDESQKYLDLTKANYFIGHEAGKSNTDGLYNSFTGYKAGYSNTIGERNVFLGYYSGYSNTEGASNLFIGDSSGYSNINGFYNIYLGNLSGKYNSSGYENVGIGVNAGYKNSTGNRNIFIGRTAGYNNTIGEDNIMIGNSAGFENTTASNNIFMGNLAGYTNLTGSENIFIGKESGFSNTEGKLNVCIGYQSGYSLTTGNYNSYLGFLTGYHNTIGTFNTFVGAQAGMYNTESNNNTFIGSYVAAEDTCGMDNTYLGAAAGRYSSGNRNTFIGSISGESTRNTHNNVYVGAFTGRENLYGNYNVFLGNFTGYWNDGDNNVFIGYAAGSESRGDSCIFIGNNAGLYNQSNNKLFIENSNADSTEALIWGDLRNNDLRINAHVGINANPTQWENLNIEEVGDAADLRIAGEGNIWNYSSLILSAKNAENLAWQINHRISNDLELTYYNGVSYEDMVTFPDTGGIVINGNIIPMSTELYTLGTESTSWKNIYSLNSVTVTSDERLKTNITNLDYGINEIMKLRPVKYNWKNHDSSNKKIGLIAQEVDKVIHEVTNTGNDEFKTMGINYTDIIPVLIKGMQEQQGQIESLKTENENLKQKLNEIIDKIDNK